MYDYIIIPYTLYGRSTKHMRVSQKVSDHYVYRIIYASSSNVGGAYSSLKRKKEKRKCLLVRCNDILQYSIEIHT